ncbi:MAG: radical SAM protein [bacterium]|nr:radical SAM protein [bacterium]
MELKEDPIDIRNIGWTLGNECPFRCSHCYSMSARQKGMDMTRGYIDRIVSELAKNRVETVNLGGNEPLFTNGLNPRSTLLPYILERVIDAGIIVGLTSAGVTVNYMAEHHQDSFRLLNDIDVSLDSPFPEEHNTNRGAPLFNVALRALRYCQDARIEHTIIMCGMNWNLTPAHLRRLVELAKETGSNVRINFLKPTEMKHFVSMPSVEQFYRASELLLEECVPIELGEPLLRTAVSSNGRGCPCGTKSFRIHSITPEGKVPVSPCVYLHDYRVGDLLTGDLYDIVRSPQFREFRRRRANPQAIGDCAGCNYSDSCRGGCAARAFLAGGNPPSLWVKDPYCLADFEKAGKVFAPERYNGGDCHEQDKTLVHRDYLCTLILVPK